MEPITVEDRWDSAAIKARAGSQEEAGTPESLGKCKVEGENLTARHKIPPVDGTVLIADNGHSETGVCSLCGTRVKLSTKGMITGHVMRGETLPPSPALSEPNIIPTDTGSRVGDPEAGSKRRADDIDGAFQRGSVEIKVKPESGKGKAERKIVPATLENLRTALDQELARRVKAPASVKAQAELVASLRRRVEAATQGVSKVEAAGAYAPKTGTAHRTSGQRDESRLDGVALVQGANMAPVQPQKGWAAKAGTMWGPLGRERVDKEVVSPPMVGGPHGFKTQKEYEGLSRSQRRKYWEKVTRNRQRAAGARAYSAKRPVGQREGGSVKSETELLMRAPH